MTRAAMGLLAVVVVVCVAGCIGGGLLKDTPGKAVVRVNCGADEEYVDRTGATWLADREMAAGATWGAIGGETVRRVDLVIQKSTCPEVYLTERYGAQGYEFSLPNGTYNVRLHFAETYNGITAAGERVFSVTVNGETKLEDLDVFAAAGAATPLVKDLPGVAVTDGKLKIEFVEDVQSPEINGIEIFAP